MSTIYEERAEDLNDEINALISDLRTEPDLENKRVIFTQLVRLLEAEQNNARIVLEFNKLDLDEKKQDLAELVSSEEHEVAVKTNDIRSQEAETKRLEMEIKRLEATLHERELDQRLVSEHEKLEVERQAVKSKAVCEAIKVGGIALSGIFMLLGLKGAMEFEKIPDGGIVPSKILSVIFRMAPKSN